MISATRVINERAKRQLSKKTYRKQKKECMRKIKDWIRNGVKSDYVSVSFNLPPHPQLLVDLQELGYNIKKMGDTAFGFHYIDISLPNSNEEQEF